MRKVYTLFFAVFIFIATQAQVCPTHLVISQVYGGGGNAGATFKNDFIEIYNPTVGTINLTGYSVQYAAASNTSGYTLIANLSGFLKPGFYYLIQAGPTGSNGADLPNPNVIGTTTNLSGTDGKVILVNSTTAVAANAAGCPSVTVIDFVGYGSANCAEGTAVSGLTSSNASTTSIKRNTCADTDNNSADFSTSTPPTPRSAPANSLLPITFTNLKATQKGSGIELAFSNLSENDVLSYSIERSSNGIQYSAVGSMQAVRNNGSKADYTVVDAQPFADANYYRIKAVEAGGKVSYSLVVKVNLSLRGSDLLIYPNPVRGGQLGFQINKLLAGIYTLTIRNSAGQVVGRQTVKHDGGLLSQTILLPTTQAGIYYLELQGGVSLHKTFVVQ